MNYPLRKGSETLRFLSALVTCSVLCLGAWPSGAEAVIEGQADGDAHPNVGMINAFDAEGGGFICTGTLVAPSIVLTDAHCVADDPAFPPIVRYEVSFEPQAFVNPPDPTEMRNAIIGTPDPNLAWTWEAYDSLKGIAAHEEFQAYDIGLVHLAQPAAEVYPGITPAPIVGAGALDSLPREPENVTVTQVGYGTQRSGPTGRVESLYIDGTRNRSSFPLRKVTARLLYGNSNPKNKDGYGLGCYGDSGSPWLLNGEVIALYTFFRGSCTNVVGGTRLDTGPARAFLRSRGLVP